MEDLSTQSQNEVNDRAVQLQNDRTRLEKKITDFTDIPAEPHKLSRVFRDAADAILIEDLSGTIIEMNHEAERSYGWSREELIGKSMKTILLPERYEYWWQLRKRCLNGEEVRNWEGFRVDKFGRVFPTLLTIFPLMDENGRIESVATITKDISNIKKLESELRDSQRRLREFSRKSMEALEADRRTVSRELHDRIAGNLAAIKVALESTSRKVVESPKEAAIALEKTVLHLAETIKECKQLSASLRPEIIDDRGLLATIDWHTRQFSQYYSHIKIIQQIDVDEQAVPDPLKIVIYRVIQEALNNAAMHSQGDAIYIRLKKTGGFLEAEVEDNGRGFDFDEVSHSEDRMSGYGLKSMRERVELIGGSFSLHAAVGLGTCIRVGFEIGEEHSL